MKQYTLLEAIKELLKVSEKFNRNPLSIITYDDGKRNKFVVQFEKGERYFVNLDDYTYKTLPIR